MTKPNLEEKIQNKQLPFTTPWQYLLYITKPNKKWAWGALLVVVVASALEQSVSYLFKIIVDAVEAGDTKTALAWALAFPVALLLIQLLFRLSGVLGMQWVVRSRKVGYDYLFAHTLRHSHTYFGNRFAGAIHNKIRNVVDGMDHLIPEILWTYLNSAVSFLVTFLLIITVDTLSAFVFFALAVALVLVNMYMSPKKQRLSYANAAASSTLQAGIVDVIGNVSATRQYAQIPYEQTRGQHLTKAHHDTNLASWRQTEFMLLINGLVLFVFTFAMFYVLVLRWDAGGITTGDFVLVASLIAQISGTLIFIGRAFNSSARMLGEVKEGFAELFVPFDITDAADATPLQVTAGAITCADVNFAFKGVSVFRDFHLHIPAGQRLGVVGPSGAGKSTLVSLLLRQHDVDSGSISIDGQDIKTVTQNSLRASVAVVPQEPVLFHRTIRENIQYGNLDASQAEIEAVAKKAQAHDFIMSLPEGYDTLVGERGVKLSGGQKQRVAIARAMLKNAPILVLDEATSALDSESETAVQTALHHLMHGKTVVAIAHRLSTLSEMDRIIVLDNGAVVEDGTHASLQAYGGVYKRLWEHQAGTFLND